MFRLPFLTALAIVLNFTTPAAASTFYVDAASAGGNGSSWATACKTVTQGLSAAGSGDTVEIAGGTYSGETLTASVAGVTVTGSTASGKNGTVTIRGVEGQPVLTVSAQTTWRRIVFDGTGNTDQYTVVVSITGGAPTFEQCTLGPGMQLLSVGAGGATFSRCTITGVRRGTEYGQAISIASTTSPVTFNYCLFSDMQFNYIQPHTASRIDFNNCLLAGFSGYVLYAGSSASVTDGVHFKNCLLMANGFNSPSLIQSLSAAAPVTLTHCLTQPRSPVNITQSTQLGSNVTEDSPLVPGSPGLTHGRRQALVNLGIDDAIHLDMWSQMSAVANAYGIRTTLALNATEDIGSTDWGIMQGLVNAGNEVAAHTAHHVYLPEKNLLNVTAENADATLTVTSTDAAAQTLTLAVGGSTVASFDLAATGYDTIGGLSSAINALDGFAASAIAISGTSYTTAPVLSRDLNATSVTLTPNVQVSLARNDTQFFADEITAPKDTIQSQLTQPNSSTPYVCNSFVYPFLGADNDTIAATGAAGFTAARGGYYGSYAMGGFWTSSTSPGGYDTLNIWSIEPGQAFGKGLDAATLARRVSALLEWAKFTGAAISLYSHGEDEYSLSDWTALIDVLRADTEVTFATLQNIREYVATNGQLSSGATYVRTEPWPDVADYTPTADSALLRAGAVYTTAMTDFGGHTVPAGTIPAVGLYQWPGNAVPTPTPGLLLLLLH
ncbi:hypothetical protein [Solidesulfovibrio alcoholivorans]|uniref:hypothetical protein n=1 Tax=Solidesulfovibrio alcoholivorans TaxID=81406 RepID=UPI000ACAEFFA|nr:hypothetical protein [Solidesulfovibrio alcoholivorans]